MRLNTSFSPKEFLKSDWQQRPKLFKKVVSLHNNLPDAEILAGLACEEFIESRLIIANEQKDDWKCEYGYFAEQRFADLDNKQWTLLIQNVDDFIPEVKELSNAFDFLPKWRLDDVMMSYATRGGGVGPHFDYYDVFLLQTSGSREWIIGQDCDTQSQLREHEDMKLLEAFQAKETYILTAGDMLYIPAGVAHWGTALSDDCITASIGFRAPAYAELLSAAIPSLAETFTQDQRYKDPEIMDDKYLIPDTIKTQFAKIYEHLNKEDFIEELAHQFSLQVTDTHHPELLEENDINLRDIEKNYIQQNPNSRFAYRIYKEQAILYINGESFTTDNQSAKAICDSKFSAVQDKGLLCELINKGALMLN